MKPPIRFALYAALVASLALPALSVGAVAKDHDHEWADRNNDRDGDRDKGKKSHLSEMLKQIFGEDSDRGSTGRDSTGSGGHISGVPGPIVGAGLPIFAAGYGVYWLVRRRRRSQ